MSQQCTILAVITARGGSKGIPGKNIKELGGKPLIAYTIEVAQQSRLITHLIVSTDDQQIAQVARDYGAEVPFLRPKELADDYVGHIPVMQHAIACMETQLGIRFDYTAILQPTSPLRSVEDIDLTLTKLVDSGADSAVTLVAVEDNTHPVKAKKLEGDTVVPYALPEPEGGTRRQDLPAAYRRSCAVYAMKRDIIMSNRLYGDHTVGLVVPQERSVDINDAFDWIKAEYMLEQLIQQGRM